MPLFCQAGMVCAASAGWADPWVVLAGFLLLLMQAGFGLSFTGLCRAKNAAHTMAISFLVFALVLLGFFATGYAILTASRSFALVGVRDVGTLAAFVLLAGYAGVSGAIPAGATAERWSFRSFFAFAIFVGAVLFPVAGRWIWGGGWLARLGLSAHVGHGAVDYAGSCVVHLTGGAAAFAAAWALGPRSGKYDDSGNPKPIFGHDVPMVMLGTLLLAFCWLGFNAGRSFLAQDGRVGLIAVNTLLAAGAGALSAAVYMWARYGRPDPSLTCNGTLAGLVAVSGSCAFVPPWAALLIATLGGVLAVWGVLFLERSGIDDPVGAISVHGVAGAWGTIALALFADGSFGEGYNGVAGPVRGLFYGGGAAQLLCQLIAVVACIVWAAGATGVILLLLARIFGTNRVPAAVEAAGLDIPEMGAPGYPEFMAHLGPEGGAQRR